MSNQMGPRERVASVLSEGGSFHSSEMRADQKEIEACEAMASIVNHCDTMKRTMAREPIAMRVIARRLRKTVAVRCAIGPVL